MEVFLPPDIVWTMIEKCEHVLTYDMYLYICNHIKCTSNLMKLCIYLKNNLMTSSTHFYHGLYHHQTYGAERERERGRERERDREREGGEGQL